MPVVAVKVQLPCEEGASVRCPPREYRENLFGPIAFDRLRPVRTGGNVQACCGLYSSPSVAAPVQS